MTRSIKELMLIGLLYSPVFIVPIVIILAFVVPFTILYYVYKLEEPKCDCVMDWRNPFIKYWTIATLFIYCITAIFGINPIVMIITPIMSAVSLYALFTYIGDINEQQCKCAIDNMPFINDFLYYYRWFMIIGLFVWGLSSFSGVSKIAARSNGSRWLSFRIPDSTDITVFGRTPIIGRIMLAIFFIA
jgi:succinate dehydrogenase hydrophobic anchor subunit